MGTMPSFRQGGVANWPVRSFGLSGSRKKAAGSTRRACRWVAGGLVIVRLPATKAPSPAMRKCGNCAIWAMPPIAHDCPRDGRATRYGFPWRGSGARNCRCGSSARQGIAQWSMARSSTIRSWDAGFRLMPTPASRRWRSVISKPICFVEPNPQERVSQRAQTYER